jgi:hypothetical protein
MGEQKLTEINLRAAFVGFGVDWVFSELVGLVVMAIILLLKGVSLNSEQVLPSDVMLARQIVGVVGAMVGGVAAGYVARRRGSLHGVLGSVLGLVVFFCSLPIVEESSLNIGDFGFIVLNLVAAGYGGGAGERWRARRERGS